MADVIGTAMSVIEVIGLIRGVYNHVKGMGKEIDDAMADCINMETDVKSLKKLFDKQTSSKYPEQCVLILSFEILYSTFIYPAIYDIANEFSPSWEIESRSSSRNLNRSTNP